MPTPHSGLAPRNLPTPGGLHAHSKFDARPAKERRVCLGLAAPLTVISTLVILFLGACQDESTGHDSDDHGTTAGPVESGAPPVGPGSASGSGDGAGDDSDSDSDGDGDGDGDSDSDEPGGPPVIPEWILRDADKEPVPALVSPGCGHPLSAAGPCPPPIIGGEFTHNCVIVSVFDDLLWNVSYRLEDGSAHACFRHFDDWVEPAGFYISDDCSGPAYTTTAGTAALRVVAGELYYAPGEGIEVESSFTEISKESGNCVGFTFGSGTTQVYRLVPVPTEALGLLPNPPYTLTLEH